jgi:hypothetical protein
MRNHSSITHCLLALSIVTFLCAHPASAVTKRARLASVRVTTGVVAITGWEKALIKNDPSLRHWHWDPLYEYKTGYPSIPANAGRMKGKIASQAVANEPRFHYTKPTHLPLPTRSRPDPNILESLTGKIEVPRVSEAPPQLSTEAKLQKSYSTQTKPELLDSGKANMSVHARLASKSRGI